DLHSRQYKRWGPLRFIWQPYMRALSHRSRLSHGLLLSTLIRVVYFVVVISVLASGVLYARNRWLYGAPSTWQGELTRVGMDMQTFWDKTEKQYFLAAFAGLWLGAAAHTISDVTWTVLKKLWKTL
ncbi:MAG: DUF2227 family putative metal-binding protein, partial [Blastocatellia bacterium]